MLTRPVALSAATLIAVSAIGAFASRTTGGLVFDEAGIGVLEGAPGPR
jgi:hypothetical protein